MLSVNAVADLLVDADPVFTLLNDFNCCLIILHQSMLRFLRIFLDS